MEMKNILLAGVMVYMGISLLVSCQEEGLVVNGNDISYINFNKNLTKDTTRICFEIYPLKRGWDVKIAEVPVEVAIFGRFRIKIWILPFLWMRICLLCLFLSVFCQRSVFLKAGSCWIRFM